MSEHGNNKVDSPSCQPKLLSIRTFLPMRQLIASEVKQIKVKLTLIVVDRRSAMVSDGLEDQDLMPSN
jgi:hypothetical protein